MNSVSPNQQLIFVYGTLMQGFCRHHHLQGARFVANVRTQPLYRLVNCGSYPGLVHATSGRAVEGELWSVGPERIRHLDEVEGVDEGLYRRDAVLIEPPFDNLPVQAYFYLASIEGLADCGARWT